MKQANQQKRKKERKKERKKVMTEGLREVSKKEEMYINIEKSALPLIDYIFRLFFYMCHNNIDISSNEYTTQSSCVYF